MNLLQATLLFVIGLHLAWAQKLAANSSPSSGKDFQKAMEGFGKTQTNRPIYDDLYYEETIKVKAEPKILTAKTREYSHSHNNGDISKLTESLTGAALPEFIPPPLSPDETKYKETPEQRAKRLRRQSSYAALLEENKGKITDEMFVGLLDKVMQDEEMKETAKDQYDLYQRNKRPKYLPTVLRIKYELEEQQIKAQLASQKQQEAEKSYKLKPRKKPFSQRMAKPANITLGTLTMEQRIQIAKDYMKTPQGTAVSVAVAFLTLIFFIYILR